MILSNLSTSEPSLSALVASGIRTKAHAWLCHEETCFSSGPGSLQSSVPINAGHAEPQQSYPRNQWSWRCRWRGLRRPQPAWRVEWRRRRRRRNRTVHCSTFMRCVHESCAAIIICRYQSLIGIKHSGHAAASNFKAPMLSGVEGSGAHTILGGSENHFHPPRLQAHASGRLHQRSGVRESRVRGGAASWPSLVAAAVCGGVQECNVCLYL